MEDAVYQNYVKAGKIAAKVRDWGSKLIKPGVTYLEVADKVEAKIKEEGGGLPFPTNISVNDIAAHYVPKYKDPIEFQKEDMVKLDLGVEIDGYIADTALTIDLGGRHSKMLEANEKALNDAISLVKPGASIAEIGSAVYDAITGAGYKPIENLSGHQVEQYELHAGISIPNIPVPYDKKLEEGMVIAIEPFATDGAGHVIESPKSEIYSLINWRPSRIREARTLFKEISDRHSLPFASRWYAEKIPQMKLSLILNQLTKSEVLHAYPPLHDRLCGKVSQFEHTLIVTEDGCEVTTK